MTGPELFALAHGRRCEGPLRCFYCGAACDGSHPRRLGEGFHDWPTVAFPRSTAICEGCVLALNEARIMPGREKPQKTRTFSWLVTAAAATAYTKADVAVMRSLCLSPPPAPWALTIAESGQKHTLFRMPVNGDDGAPCRVQLELTTVLYRPDELRGRITLCTRIAAAIGKPVLGGPLDLSASMRYSDYHGVRDETDAEVELWNLVSGEPLSRLAAFLSPAKEEAQHEFPERDDVRHPAAGRGPVAEAAGGAGGRDRERSLFG